MSQLLSKHLSSNGDGTGTTNAIGDYSVTPLELFITPPAGSVYRIARLMMFMEDGKNFDPDGYGKLAELTNGIRIVKKGGAVDEKVDFTNGYPIKTNGGWGRMCFDIENHAWTGAATNHFLLARFTFTRFGSPLRLGPSDRLSILINDDLTGLVEHTFLIQGEVFSLAEYKRSSQ